jgi:hypothetical protein
MTKTYIKPGAAIQFVPSPSEAQEYLPIPWIKSWALNTWYDTIVRREDILESAVHYQLFLDIHTDNKMLPSFIGASAVFII